MRYFKVPTEQMAQELSALIYTVMYTPNIENATQYLFGWFPYNTEWVIAIPENYHCPVFIKDNFNAVIEQLGSIIGFALAEGEGQQIIAKLATGSIILEEIIPSGLVEISEQDFLATLPQMPI